MGKSSDRHIIFEGIGEHWMNLDEIFWCFYILSNFNRAHCYLGYGTGSTPIPSPYHRSPSGFNGNFWDLNKNFLESTWLACFWENHLYIGMSYDEL